MAATFSTLYSPAAWADLADFYTALALRDPQSAGRAISALQARVPGLQRGEDYPSFGGALGSTCVDTITPARRIYPLAADVEDARFPDFGRYRAWIDLPCLYFKNAGIRDGDVYVGSWQQTTSSQVLVLGTRFDPATPYRNTRPYADRFRNSVVLTLNGWDTPLWARACALTPR